MPAIGVHHTSVDKTGSWDAGANLKRLGDSPSEAALRDMHAWVDPKGTADAKSSYKLPHHNVDADGKVGSANMSGVESAMGRLNGGGLDVPEADRAGIHAHLAAHYKDADMKAPDLQSAAPEVDEPENPEEPEEPEMPGMPKMAAGFQAVERLDMAMDAGTANDADRTIDCVWYTGQAVDRMNWMTGEQYTLTLGMEPDQCDLARLNSGAPILDSHNTTAGGDMLAPDTVRSQLGVVVPGSVSIEGGKGKAKLRFSKLPEVAPIWQNVKDKIITKLSVGTNIISRKDVSPDPEQKKKNFLATKHQPFEISLASIPADYGTTFLSGDGNRPPRLRLPSGTEIYIDGPRNIQEPSSTTRATAQSKEQPVDTQQQVDAGAEARKVELAAASKKAADDAVKAERERCNSIRLMAAPFKIDQAFLAGLIDNGSTVEDSRKSIFDELAKQAAKTPIDGSNPSVTVNRDQRDTLRAQMEASVYVRCNPAAPKEIQELGRDFAGLTLLELGRECLQIAGVKTRGMSRGEVARVALQGRYGAQEYFGGMETTSDLPNILANVANKTLRMAYEQYPRTFPSFCTMVSAKDFKPVNRVQLSDLATLHAINEKGEYHRTYLSDSKETYSLATFGDIVPITRKVIINDDLEALNRVPGSLGTAAARLESDTVWAVITANAAMSDSVNLFHATHANLQGSNALSTVDSIGTARAMMRKQTGPKGTILNLIPKFIIVPAALETKASQLTNPINIASTVAANVVPEFIRTMYPIVEPRLDAVVSVGSTNWFLAADPSQITSIEYCYLEGQQGVYIETRQGFDTDGVEIKARLDFAAAAIDFRGLQKNTSA